MKLYMESELAKKISNSPPLLAEKVPQSTLQRPIQRTTSDNERALEQGITRKAQCTI